MSAKQTVSKKKKPDTNLKTSIIEAYVDIAYTHGVAEVTIDKIAKRANVAFGSVLYHFGESRDSLLLASIAHVAKTAQDYIETYTQLPSSEINVHRYIRGTYQWAMDHPAHATFWMYYYYLNSTKAIFKEVGLDVYARAWHRIERMIYEDIGKKKIKQQENVPELAQKIHAIVMGFFYRGIQSENTKKEFEKVSGLAIELCDSLLL